MRNRPHREPPLKGCSNALQQDNESSQLKGFTLVCVEGSQLKGFTPVCVEGSQLKGFTLVCVEALVHQYSVLELRIRLGISKAHTSFLRHFKQSFLVNLLVLFIESLMGLQIS